MTKINSRWTLKHLRYSITRKLEHSWWAKDSTGAWRLNTKRMSEVEFVRMFASRPGWFRGARVRTALI